MFESFDFDTLMETMLSNIRDDLDKREGSVIYDAIAPAALELANFYIALDMVMNEVFAESASYYYLIKRAAERGLFPKEETCAVGKMIVTPAGVTISVGDRFNLNDLNYTVTSIINDETGEYQIECETAGIAGNQQLGELLPVETANELNTMESAELAEILIPGEDEEDVETFRERYFALFRNEAYGGNKADYIAKVNEIDGVGGCKVKRSWKGGYSPSAMIPNDAAAEWFHNQSVSTVGQEVYNWLKTIYDAAAQKLLTVGGTVSVVVITSDFKKPSSVLVDTVQRYIDPTEKTGEGDGIAPIGHVVKVYGVNETTVDITTNITYDTNYGFEILKEAIENTIDAYLQELRQTWDSSDNLVVRVSKIESLLLVLDGIIDITDTKINNAAENLIIDSDCIPVRGDVVG